MSNNNPPENKPPVSVAAALSLLLRHAPAADRVETVASLEASGRVLARDQIAKRDVPYHDNSAMDGYAVRVQDIVPGKQNWLLVAQQIPAGQTGAQLEPGSAAQNISFE